MKTKNQATVIAPHVWKMFGIPQPEPEYYFALPRRWRVDYAWPEQKVALEIEGGIFKKGADGQQGGRHNRAAGFLKDIEKYNALALAGFRYFRCTPQMVSKGTIFVVLSEVLSNEVR